MTLLISSLGGLGALWLTTIIVADISLLKAGHTPGMPVTSGPKTFVYRATRAHQNLLENLTPFALALLTAVIAGTDSLITGALALGFLGARALHAAAYYAGLGRPRAVGFGLGVLLIALMFGAAGYTTLR